MLQQLPPESTGKLFCFALDVSFLSLEVVIDVGSCKQRDKHDDLGRSKEFQVCFIGIMNLHHFFPELDSYLYWHSLICVYRHPKRNQRGLTSALRRAPESDFRVKAITEGK